MNKDFKQSIHQVLFKPKQPSQYENKKPSKEERETKFSLVQRSDKTQLEENPH